MKSSYWPLLRYKCTPKLSIFQKKHARDFFNFGFFQEFWLLSEVKACFIKAQSLTIIMSKFSNTSLFERKVSRGHSDVDHILLLKS